MGAISLENVTCGGAAPSAAIANSDSTTAKTRTLTRSRRHSSNVGSVMTDSFRQFTSAPIIDSPDQTNIYNAAYPKFESFQGRPMKGEQIGGTALPSSPQG